MSSQTFIPAAEYAPSSPSEFDTVEIERPPWEQTLTDLAEAKTTRLRVPRSQDLKRKQVVNAFLDAFEIIGGTTRLAVWADENPSEFYKLYAKLLPKQEEHQSSGEVLIKHVLPPTELDS